MFFKIGSIIVSPEQENISIPVEVFKGNPKDGGCFIAACSFLFCFILHHTLIKIHVSD